MVNIHTIYFALMLLLSWSRLKRSGHGGCYSKVGLPLIENSSIVEQPLDLWTLTDQYKSTATRIIQNARYSSAMKPVKQHNHTVQVSLSFPYSMK